VKNGDNCYTFGYIPLVYAEGYISVSRKYGYVTHIVTKKIKDFHMLKFVSAAVLLSFLAACYMPQPVAQQAYANGIPGGGEAYEANEANEGFGG